MLAPVHVGPPRRGSRPITDLAAWPVWCKTPIAETLVGSWAVLRKGVRSIVHAAGYDLIRRPALGHNLETHLERLLPLLRINLVLDVGANDGRTGLALREHGYRGRIISFEPGPAYTELAEVSSRDPNWLIRREAIGDAEDWGELNVTASSVFSSLHPLAPPSRDAFRDETAIVERREVQVRRLDSLYEELTLGLAEPRIFLKSDTQGHDLAVIASIQEHAVTVEAIQVEVMIRKLYENAPDPAETLAHLSAQGYRLLRSFPDNDYHGLNLFAHDWIFIRDVQH